MQQVALGHKEKEICVDAEPSALEMSPREVDQVRGYGHPDFHDSLEFCRRKAVRRPGHSLMLPDIEVGAIRISVTGWEGWVVEGLKVGSRLFSVE